MQSAKVNVQQMALRGALKSKESISILQLNAQNPQDFEQLRRHGNRARAQSKKKNASAFYARSAVKLGGILISLENSTVPAQ